MKPFIKYQDGTIEQRLRQFLLDEIEFGKANARNRDDYNTAYFSAVAAISARMLIMLDEASEYPVTESK